MLRSLRYSNSTWIRRRLSDGENRWNAEEPMVVLCENAIDYQMATYPRVEYYHNMSQRQTVLLNEYGECHGEISIATSQNKISRR
jgi:hypothetical protein